MKEKYDVIKKLDQIENQINDLWGEVSLCDINNLRKVWNDTACEEYVNVFNTLDKSIKGIVDNVNKLKLNWENYDEGVTPAQN